MCVFAHNRAQDWIDALEAAGLTFCNLLCWAKTNPAPQIRQTRWCTAHESIIFICKGSTPKHFNWLGQNEMHSVIKGPICGGTSRIHPTEKPRWLIDKLLQVSGVAGGKILDGFAGSGVVGEAALAAGMIPTLIEADEKYVNAIKVRLNKVQSDDNS